MGKANLEKAGGIVGFVAGILQMFIALSFAVVGEITGGIGRGISRTFDLFGLGGGGGVMDGPNYVWGLVFAYATVVLATLLMSGARGKVAGTALVVCAILGAFGGSAFAALGVLALTGGILALIGGFGEGGSGLRGMMATAQRMAQAAKESDTSNAPEKKD